MEPNEQVSRLLSLLTGLERLGVKERALLIAAVFVSAFAIDLITPVACVYVLPLLIATWVCSERLAFLLAAASGLCSWLAENWGVHPYASGGHAYWAASVNTGLFMAFVWAIHEVKVAHSWLLFRSPRDPLTGLYNRRAFEELAEAELKRAKRFGRPLSLVYFDVDDFKAVNDNRGHSQRDRVLQQIRLHPSALTCRTRDHPEAPFRRLEPGRERDRLIEPSPKMKRTTPFSRWSFRSLTTARGMRSGVVRALLCLYSVTWLGTASAQQGREAWHATQTLPASLGLNEALRIFHVSGLDLLVAEAQVRGAKGDARIARGVSNPDLSVGAGRSLTHCAGCSAPALSVTLSDSGATSDALFGKRGLRVDAADLALEAAKLDKRDAQRLLDAGLKQQFLAVVIAKAGLALNRKAHDMASEAVELVRKRVAAGAAADSDLLKVETDSLELEDQVDASELSLKTAKLDLAFWLGVRWPSADFDVDEALLLQAMHAPVDRLDSESILAEALRNRSDVLSAEYGERRARAAADLARRTRVPPVSLWANYAMQGSGPNATTPPTLTIGVESPLPIFYQNQGEIMKADSDLFSQRVRRAKVGSRVVVDVSSALVSLAIARKRLERMGDSLLERARRSRDLTALQYERGAASLLELLDSGRTFLSVNASYLQSISDYWTAVFSVEQASGRTFH